MFVVLNKTDMLNYEYLNIRIEPSGIPEFQFVIETHTKKRKWWQFWKPKTYTFIEAATTRLHFPIDEHGCIIGDYHIRKLTKEAAK